MTFGKAMVVSEDEVNLHMSRLIEAARALIGKPLPSSTVWNEVASKDAIRHFVYGVGDNNPLWLDEEYASKSKYGCIIAPPSFLYSVEPPSVLGPPAPSFIACIQAGEEWNWFEVIRLGDKIRVDKKIVEVTETVGKFLGRMVLIISEAIYFNQRGVVVAKARSTVIRFPAQNIRHLFNRDVSKYSEEQIKAIRNQVMAEVRRGDCPRYWEDVAIREDIPPVVKGPLTMGDLVAWFAGCGVPYKACELWASEVEDLSLERPLPAVCVPAIGYKVHPETIHVDANLASIYGIPAAFDEGPLRICWAIHMLTNWMGDEGFLKKLRVEIRDMNIYGDVTWWRGCVVQKNVIGDEHIVECNIWATNQLGDVTASGEAVITLPIRIPDSLPKIG